MFAEWLRQLRAWLIGDRFDRELDEEIEFHREMREQELREQCLSPAEAKRQAGIAFGPALAAREASRDSWGLAWLDFLSQDLRYGLRQLNRNRGFAATAILTIALGVGASAAIFTLVNAVLLRPLPYPDPDRLVVLYEGIYWNGRDRVTPDLDLHYLKDEFKSFSALGSWSRSGAVNWKSPQGVISLDAASVDVALMDLLGFQPALGRTFTAAEEREAASVLILSYATWVSRFGADPAVVGSTRIFNNEAFTIIGVARPEFRVNWQSRQPEEAYQLITRDPAYLTRNQGRNSWRYVARLQPGISADEARAEWHRVQAAWMDEQPAAWLRQTPYFELFSDQAFEYARPKIWTIAGAGALVFLIVCANLAGLLLARSVARRKELGVRASLGAARGRIARQLSVEAALLAALGGAAGLLLCFWAFYGFKGLIHFYLPRLDSAAVDGETLLYAVAASVICAALGGMTPLLARSFSSPWESLRSDASGTNARRKGRRTADVLVVVQFALSLALIVGAGLLTRTFWNLMQTDWGFDGKGLIAVTAAPSRDMRDDPRALAVLGDELAERVAALPGVGAVALSPGPPVRGVMRPRDIRLGAIREEPFPHADVRTVTANYFAVMRIPILRGAGLPDSPGEGGPLAGVIDETFAERYWPGADPLGKTFDLQSAEGGFQPAVVVGVAQRMFSNSLQMGTTPTVYLSYRQSRIDQPTAVFRSAEDPVALSSAIRRATADLGPDAPIRIQPVSEAMDFSYAEPRFYMALLSAFALLALTLAAVGLYGVIAYSVRARTAEIGLRLAVGAAPAEILRMVLSRGIRLAAIGLILGAALAWAGIRSIEGLLFGVSAADPFTIAAVCLLLFAAALLACWIPARRAASIEPVSALRQQ